MINGVCGFDQWVDNHIAVDGHGSPTLSGLCGFFMRQLFVVIQNSWNWFTAVHYSCTISELATKFHQNGLHYHWWKTPGAYQIYAAGEIYYLSIEAFKKSNCVFLRLLLASPPFPKANFSTLFSLLLICFLNFFSDESGWGIQLDLPPGNPPNNVPNYSAACASDDGCLGQGNCKADFYQRVFNM